MALEFTALPGPAKLTNKGIQVTINAAEDISTDDYRIYIDMPCKVTIEPLPQPVHNDGWEVDGELVE